MKLIFFIICNFFPPFIVSSGIFIKFLNISYHPEYVEDFAFSITTNPKNDLDYVISARGVLKKQISNILAKSQLFTKRGRFLDYSMDVCRLFSKKNSGDIFYGYLKKLMKSVKNIKFECPLEPVS